MQSNDEPLGFGPWALLSLILVLLLLFGFVVASQFRGWAGAVGISGLIFLSAGTVGALLGFIFAVPRVNAKNRKETKGDGAKAKILSTNTNLERISDWLTTMLVGVGLSQLTNLNGVFLQFRNFLADAATVYVVNGHPNAGVLPAVGPLILVLGACCGFLLMYLMTRLVLVGFFKDSEEMLRGVAVAAIRVAVAETSPQHTGTGPEGDEIAPTKAGSPNGQTGGTEASEGHDGIANAATTSSLLSASHATTLSYDAALEVMFELLYKRGGYKRVIQMSGELSRTPITKRPEYWFYLAAAFGQEMHHNRNNDEELRSARDNAIDAANRAVQIDKSFRSRLWAISNPNSRDDDLALLREDPDFRRLVGR